MALTVNDRRAVELWTGSLDDEAAAVADLRLQALEHTGVVAYEILMIRYADMLNSPDELRLEGDARVRWVQAKERLQAQINSLVQWFVNLDPAPVLNTAAEAIMATAVGGVGRHQVRTTAYTMLNNRP